MDIKKIVSEVAEKIQKDPKLLKKFKDEPIKAVEQLIGVDLPDDLVNQLIDGIKAKLAAEKVGDALQGLGKLFGK